jgi:hypothetical protein
VTQATEMRDAYIAAETAILLGQSFELAGRKLTRADLEQVRAGRREWEQRVRDEAAVAAGGGGLRYRLADFSGRCP